MKRKSLQKVARSKTVPSSKAQHLSQHISPTHWSLSQMLLIHLCLDSEHRWADVINLKLRYLISVEHESQKKKKFCSKIPTSSGRNAIPPALETWKTLFATSLRKEELARCWLSNRKEEVKGKRRATEAEWQQEMRESERHGEDAERKQLSGGIRMRWRHLTGRESCSLRLSFRHQPSPGFPCPWARLLTPWRLWADWQLQLVLGHCALSCRWHCKCAKVCSRVCARARELGRGSCHRCKAHLCM